MNFFYYNYTSKLILSLKLIKGLSRALRPPHYAGDH